MATSRINRALRDMVEARDWDQFHTPENLAKSVAIESGELLECFQWGSDADPEAVTSELADVLTYAFLLAEKLGVEVEDIVLAKMRETQKKYPVRTSRGSSVKYDQLPH